jgi:Flp pilus assembly pilin Flp
MSLAAQPAVRAAAQPATKEKGWFASDWGLLAAIAALVIIQRGDSRHQYHRPDHGAAVRGQLWLHPAVNVPQNMVAYGTDAFQARDFVRTGLVLTVIALALVMVLGATYWHWLGYV